MPRSYDPYMYGPFWNEDLLLRCGLKEDFTLHGKDVKHAQAIRLEFYCFRNAWEKAARRAKNSEEHTRMWNNYKTLRMYTCRIEGNDVLIFRNTAESRGIRISVGPPIATDVSLDEGFMQPSPYLSAEKAPLQVPREPIGEFYRKGMERQSNIDEEMRKIIMAPAAPRPQEPDEPLWDLSEPPELVKEFRAYWKGASQLVPQAEIDARSALTEQSYQNKYVYEKYKLWLMDKSMGIGDAPQAQTVGKV